MTSPAEQVCVRHKRAMSTIAIYVGWIICLLSIFTIYSLTQNRRERPSKMGTVYDYECSVLQCIEAVALYE